MTEQTYLILTKPQTSRNCSIVTLEKSSETADLRTSLHITYQLSSSLPKNIIRPVVNLQTTNTILQVSLQSAGIMQ